MIARQLSTKTAEASELIYGAASAKGTKTNIKQLQFRTAHLVALPRSLKLRGMLALSGDGARKDVYNACGVSRACARFLSGGNPEREQYRLTHELGRRFGLKSNIKDAIPVRRKGGNNAVVSCSVGTVLKLCGERIIVSGFADQHWFCHQILNLLVSREYLQLRRACPSGEAVDT